MPCMAVQGRDKTALGLHSSAPLTAAARPQASPPCVRMQYGYSLTPLVSLLYPHGGPIRHFDHGLGSAQLWFTGTQRTLSCLTTLFLVLQDKAMAAPGNRLEHKQAGSQHQVTSQELIATHAKQAPAASSVGLAKRYSVDDIKAKTGEQFQCSIWTASGCSLSCPARTS